MLPYASSSMLFTLTPFNLLLSFLIRDRDTHIPLEAADNGNSNNRAEVAGALHNMQEEQRAC